MRSEIEEKVPSTAKILLFRHLNKDINEQWVDWACDVLVAGFDTPNIRMFAAESSPFDQLKLKPLADSIFEELGLTYQIKDRVVEQYANYLVKEALEKRIDSFIALSKLRNLYLELNDEPLLHRFYILHVMKDDEMGGMQYDVDIDHEIYNYYQQWLNEHSKT